MAGPACIDLARMETPVAKSVEAALTTSPSTARPPTSSTLPSTAMPASTPVMLMNTPVTTKRVMPAST